MKRRLSSFFETGINFFINHTLMVLIIAFTLATIIILWHLERLANKQIESTALDNAQSYSQALAEFRTLYTSEVVAVAQSHGIEVSHDYKTKTGAIPLPATLSMLLGNRLGGKQSGVKSRLYSKYPFPWREISGGLNDNFAQTAWKTLQQSPQQSYYRFEDVDGRAALRYATADVMRPGCISCHNAHPDSPKHNWRVGEVRGVLEVIIPIETHMLLTNSMLRQSFILISSILMFCLICITLALRKLRLRNHEANTYAAAIAETNKKLEAEIATRKQAETELRRLSLIDPLTELSNRRYFDEVFKQEWKRAVRHQQNLAVIMIDIDYFKLYNDHYGHQAGDQCIRLVAKALNVLTVRETDTIARYGGEEFVVILPGTDKTGALKVAEAMREGVENLHIHHEFALTGDRVTISAGIASALPLVSMSHVDLLREADQALYQAKQAGRNCVKARNGSVVMLGAGKPKPTR
ncbi:diguanylate cyclase [Endozoicomonas sp. SM1973]|uniref:diguanylate cyclase n=1 Tax=Spartinivicinus marinus TaxID=2994442 RepID=A0A853HUU9_9GAMM|nr:diguanylate cyclase [Spartinivicinus marinus]MCX4028877.1 diguanylate cyclase [Spartinivicinus marinus]NYZ65540.1 diguanylate cyclase [Spartinivicinus marinus]